MIEELKENGNGEPEFSLNLGTAFMIIEHISSSSHEGVNVTENESAILSILKDRPQATYRQLAESLRMSESTVYRTIDSLKKKGILKRQNSDKSGFWEVLKDSPDYD